MNSNTQRDMLARIIMDEFYPGPQDDPMTWPAQVWRLADAIVERIKPRTITTVEELDALPEGAVVISPEYRHYRNGMQVSFQKWDDGRWYRGGRGRDTHPEYFLPATVLHEPEAEATR